ncbi:PAS domain-containing protein [Candidatus Parcubacteria bacterium]|nr:PAS domain-containing protein [Candidatus Parcubacteria bacterium]
MFFRLFNWLLKRTPYSLAVVVPTIFWGIVAAGFGGSIIIIVGQANFEITGTTGIFILSLIFFVSFASILIFFLYGLSRLFGKKWEKKELKILNDNIINGHISSYLSKETLLNIHHSLSKINIVMLNTAWRSTLGVIFFIALTEWFFSKQLINIPIILTGGFIALFITCICVSPLYEILTAPARKECKMALADRGIPFEESHFISLKIKSKFFIVLIGLILVVLLTFVFPLTPALIFFSLLSLTIFSILSEMIFSSIYSAFLEIKESAKNLEEGQKTTFFSGSLDKEVIDLSKSLNKTANEIYSNRKQLEETLKETKRAKAISEEEKNKTLSIIHNFADGLLVLNDKDEISLINPRAEIFFNIKNQDLIGKSILELDSFPKFKFLVEIFRDSFSLLNKNKKILRREFKIQEDLILEISILPIMKEKRKSGTLVIFHDITREKRIENMKTEFVSLAAHQLRTPLSGIKWALKMFLEGNLGKITGKQKKFIKGSYDANEKMIFLINDLLNVTSIEEGKYLLKKSLVDIKDIVQLSVNSYQKEIKTKKIKFDLIEPKRKLPKVMADREKIILVVENLLENAVRYTKPGGKIMIALKKAKKEIEFSIEDNGTGIPQDQQERMFTKFFRASNVVRIDTEGRGLGLYITKNIIEAHKGRIWFKSKEDRGTKFYFTLPY